MTASDAYALIRKYGTQQEITYAATHLAYGRTDSVRALLSRIAASCILAA